MDKSSRLSRLSVHPRSGPRESVWAPNPDRGDTQAVCSPFVRECVLAMEDCCNEAYEAQSVLREGTYDLPRISRILYNERVFLLVDEATVRRYKADLTDEIEPQINELISRAEKGLRVLLKRESTLRSKTDTAPARPPSQATVNTNGMSKSDARKMRMLCKQRERLGEELAVLQAEVDALEMAAMKR